MAFSQLLGYLGWQEDMGALQMTYLAIFKDPGIYNGIGTGGSKYIEMFHTHTRTQDTQ